MCGKKLLWLEIYPPVSQQEAINLTEVAEELLDPAPANPSELIDRPRILPPGRSPCTIPF